MDTTHHEKPHPNEKLYVKVALWLGIVTLIEIFLSYTGLSAALTIALLLILSIIKFAAVVGYFMHLKFDNPTLRKPLITGIILAGTIYTAVLLNLTLH